MTVSVNSPQDQVKSATTGADDVSLKPGAIIDGRYELVERLGTGGFGTVFRAKHLQLDRPVAVKVLHPRFVEDPEAVKRFQQEAQAVSLLDHPNVIRVFSFGLADGIPYMATELLSGKSLFDLVQQNGRLQPVRAIPIFLQICQGLKHAHDCGILHRDLKPGNVMLIEHAGNSEFAKVLDFGFAKVSSTSGINMQNLTQTGTVVGDPLYMSPEQCRAQPLDVRSDIYSMGCLMYEALAGEPPFNADNAVSIMYKRLIDDPEPFAEKNKAITGGLEDIVLRALEREPDARFQSVQELSDALSSELDAINSGTAKRASDKPRKKTRKPQRIVLVALTGACVFALAAGGIWLVKGNSGGDTDIGAGGTIDAGNASSTQLRVMSADLLRKGNFEEAQLLAEQAVQRARRDNRSDLRISAEDQMWHTNACLGRLSECLENAKDSLKYRNKVFGEHTTASAAAEGRLGQTYFAMGELRKASHHLEVLAGNDNAFNSMAPQNRLIILDQLASANLALSEWDDAERAITRYDSLVRGSWSAPPEMKIVAKVLMSRLRAEQKRFNDADKLLQEAFKDASTPNIDGHVRARIMEHRSTIARQAGDIKKSEELAQLATKERPGEGVACPYFAAAEGRLSFAYDLPAVAHIGLRRALNICEYEPYKWTPDMEMVLNTFITNLRREKREGETASTVSLYKKIVKSRPLTN